MPSRNYFRYDTYIPNKETREKQMQKILFNGMAAVTVSAIAGVVFMFVMELFT